jgi:hypothetical protein
MGIVMSSVIILSEGKGQGKVIINEFMSGSGCSQYIELKNLGPGRENIGCYILASETGIITIPPNTWLDPGDLFLIAGVAEIANCPTTSSPKAKVNLNWTNCSGCSSPNMTTSTSFFGNRNSQDLLYPLVLYNSNATPMVIDAVAEGSINKPIATSGTQTSVTSSCATRTIDISTLNKSDFEDTGPAPGTNASASRKIDGSCEWNKSPNKQTPGLSNTIGGVTTNPIVVSTNYSLNCLGGDSFTATQNISITLTGITQYYFSTAYATDSLFSQNLVLTPSTLSNTTSITLTAPNPLKPGFYNYLFEVSPGATCDQKQLLFQIIDPIMTVSPTYSVDCLGGIAELKITNPGATNTMAPFYFPIAYNVTSSTSTFTTSGTDSDPDVVRITNIPQGTYTATLTPASQFACPKSVPFSITTAPLTALSATVSTTAACSNQTADAQATISLTNPNLNLYYPIDFSLNKVEGSVSSFVSSGTFSSETKVLSGLSSGTYSLILDPQADGCLANSSFTILVSDTDCSLQQTLKNLSVRTSGLFLEFSCNLDAGGILSEFFLESSLDGKNFTKVTNIVFENKKGFQDIRFSVLAGQETFFRLQLLDIYNKKLLSPILRISPETSIKGVKLYPNPFRDQLGISINAAKDDLLLICIMNTEGVSIKEEKYSVRKGLNSFSINTSTLAGGSYYLCTQMVTSGEKQVTQVIKQ